MRGNRKGPKDRRMVTRSNAKPSTHTGPGEWKRGYDHRRDARCGATTVRDPEATDWTPEDPDTVVKAECIQGQQHAGWHLAEDGYAWHPDDDTQHALLAP